MDIFHISAECFPVAKVGGLGDVVGALPKYQNKLGHSAKVVLPGYDNKFTNGNKFDEVHQGKLRLGQFVFDYTVKKLASDKLGFELFVIAIPQLFDRPNVYSYDDDTERFMAFQIAFLNWLTEIDQRPDILHCHDHHTGLIPFMVSHCYQYNKLRNIPTVITIHNGQYQGWFSKSKIDYIPKYDHFKTGLLEWGGIINPLASALKCAWKITTVSPSYLDEICSYANGIESLFRYERGKSLGILNGIDTEVWNPKTDVMIDNHYSSKNFKKGKAANKKFLCEQFNLDASKPMFTFIGRLVGEKGADLLPQMCSTALNSNPGEITILILGSGDTGVENALQSMKGFYNGYFNCYIGYNEKLAHIVYAGADYLLMPSRVEPCGLNQMYAMRYGTIPIVRRTGGLKDTVLDIGDGGIGICHDKTSVDDVNHSVSRGIDLYNDKKKFDDVRAKAMAIDHSWDSAAAKYISVYKSIIPYI